LRPCLRRLWRSGCADWDPQAERQRKSTRVAVLHDYARLIEHARQAQDQGHCSSRRLFAMLPPEALWKMMHCPSDAVARVPGRGLSSGRPLEDRHSKVTTWVARPSVQLASTLEPPAGLSICDTTRQRTMAALPMFLLAALQPCSGGVEQRTTPDVHRDIRTHGACRVRNSTNNPGSSEEPEAVTLQVNIQLPSSYHSHLLRKSRGKTCFPKAI
jgi:hypothetical protein